MSGVNRPFSGSTYSDTFKRAEELNKDDLKNLDKALKEATLIKASTISKKRKDDIVKFYYYKDKEKELYYNVAEAVKKGKMHRYLYSATNKIKK